MDAATFRFYKELNDFLPPDRRGQRFAAQFKGSPGIKDIIESLGVPHTEVDVVLVNQTSVDFKYRLRPGDDVAVYPVFESFDITPILRLWPEPLRKTAFIGDVHLGRLCRMLRLAGFDTLYRNDYDDREIVRIAKEEGRIVLTRDRELLKRTAVARGYCVRSSDWREQVREVTDRFDLSNNIRPFTICAECNGKISPVDKSEIVDKLQEKTRLYYDRFSRCLSCGKIYWEGSHYEKLLEFISKISKSQIPKIENS